jgi:hypothetical protein
MSLILNGIIIVSRSEDYYINATQLCQAGNKKFNDWFRLDTTKELIKVLEAETGITASRLIYIKDDDKWSKENDDKLVIKKVIKDVANKNIKQIPVWTNLNPDCKNADSKSNDQYLKIVMNSMSGGSNEEQNHNIEKIIKNITKSVIIEK